MCKRFLSFPAPLTPQKSDNFGENNINNNDNKHGNTNRVLSPCSVWALIMKAVSTGCSPGP